MNPASVAVGLGAVALAACSSRHGLTPDGGPKDAGSDGQTVITLRPSSRDVDVLFMLDNSSNMSFYQVLLADAFSSYANTLAALPGGLPNLHIGIVSSSLGAGREPGIDGCAPGGDQGILHAKPTGSTCTRGSLNPGESFIANIDGQPNYRGDLADVFGCIALLGSGGCGFEHQLASVMRALGADGAPAPAENAGFLRAGAYLQVVLFTNEDDCSAPPDSDLFDKSSMTLTDPLGPLQSYRCNEFGHLCGGKAPPRMPPGEADLGTCVSNENGRLLPVGGMVTALKNIKSDPSLVLVAAIAGPPTPYKVNVGPAQVKGDMTLWPYVESACRVQFTGPDGTSDGFTDGDPGVRIKQWVDAFGDNGVFQSVCADSYAAALTRIAQQIEKALGPPCLPATVDPNKCTVVETGTDGPGLFSNVTHPRCKDASDTGTCWDVGPSTATCSQPFVLRNPGIPPGANPFTTVTCAP